MPPLLWTILEMLLGLWVFRNRRRIQRAAEFLLAPPPLETETLPHADDNPTLTGIFAGAFIGLMANNFGMFRPPLLTLGSMALGAVGMGILFYRMNQCVQSLAPNQPWRALTESLAARAGIQNVAVRMKRSKSRQIRVSPKGVVTLPSALLRDATPDELAFHLGRALWEIHSGDAQQRSIRVRNIAIVSAAMLPLFYIIATFPLLYLPVMAFGMVLLRMYLPGDKAAYLPEKDRFALGLTGDLPTAVRVIEAEEERRATSTADIRQGLRARQSGYERARRLSEWWALQQRFSPPGISYGQAAPQVQRLGKP